jgi:ABC-type uncharacterized transport system auxiliary subunit
MAVISFIGASGCLTPEYTPITQYTIEPSIELAEAPASDLTIGIRPLTAGQSLKRNVFYRDPDLQVGNLADVQWSEMPSDMVARYMFDAIVASKRFADVGLAVNVSRPTFMLTGELRRFDLVRIEEPWEAVCEVYFELRTSESREAVWAETVIGRAPLSSNHVQALPQAMSDAVAAVIQQSVSAIAAVEPPQADSGDIWTNPFF